MAIDRLLLSVDVSEAAPAAAHHAVGLAAQLDAALTILHVDDLHTYGLDRAPELDDIAEELEERRLEVVQFVAELARDEEVEHDVVTRIGPVAPTILELCDSLDADAVVLARAGAGGARRMLLGSVTRRVVQLSPVPVVVVPFHEDDPPIDHPIRYEHLLACTDFSEDAAAGLRYLAGLVEQLDGRATVYHAAEVPVFGGLTGQPGLWLPSKTRDHLERETFQRLARALESLGSTRFDLHASIASRVEEAIVEAADELHCDAIVAPAHGKGFIQRILLGSTTLRLLKLSTCPVVVLPRASLDIG